MRRKLFLVEAPGFEPGSGSTTSKRLHAYLTYWDFRIRCASKKARSKRVFAKSCFDLNPIPLNLTWRTGEKSSGQPACRRFFWTAGIPREARRFYIKQRVPIQCWRLCFYLPFYPVPVTVQGWRGDRATACSLDLITPVEACRPLFFVLYHKNQR